MKFAASFDRIRVRSFERERGFMRRNIWVVCRGDRIRFKRTHIRDAYPTSRIVRPARAEKIGRYRFFGISIIIQIESICWQQTIVASINDRRRRLRAHFIVDGAGNVISSSRERLRSEQERPRGPSIDSRRVLTSKTP